MIHVRTLGTAEVLVGEHRIAPDSAMLFALALFLSVSAGQRVHRSRLIDLLWPEAPDGGRRHALRQLLYRLRSRGFPLSLDGEELVLAEDEVESDIRRVLASRWPEEARPEEVLTLPVYELRKRQVEVIKCLHDDIGDQHMRKPLVVGGNHIPRRVRVTGGSQCLAIGGHVRMPLRAFEQVGR